MAFNLRYFHLSRREPILEFEKRSFKVSEAEIGENQRARQCYKGHGGTVATRNPKDVDNEQDVSDVRYVVENVEPVAYLSEISEWLDCKDPIQNAGVVEGHQYNKSCKDVY